jgi:poly-gamma-glutamate synthesis protein (capsule biosynthesis protein)
VRLIRPIVLTILLALVLTLTAGVVFLHPSASDSYWWKEPITSPASATVLFVGDIMLARDVEKRLTVESAGYALSAVKHLFGADMVVGNFEASIPSTHKPTENMTFRFSVRPDLSEELSMGGFTHLSLANNHALDFGADGLANTRKILTSQGLQVAGHPSTISTSSVWVENIADEKVVIVNINATYGYPNIDAVLNALPKDISAGGLRVAYIHWGDEYELLHNEDQAEFAYMLIDAGFDLIVGHHPHVVQGIERYRDGLIFYSLGNFIFDQYWRPEVQQGLLLKLTEINEEWQIELKPVESATVRVQPREMVGDGRTMFLADLAARSSRALQGDIAKGVLLLQF